MKPLRDYQRGDIDFLSARKHGIIGEPPGAGKTRIAIETIREFAKSDFGRENFGPWGPPILIVCSAVAMYVWQDELAKWEVPVEPVLIRGNPKYRLNKWKAALKGGCAILTYNMLTTDYKKGIGPAAEIIRKFRVVIADEAHKIRNRKNTFYKALSQVTKDKDKCLFMTGTPIENGPHDLWTMLHMCDPKTFSSYWGFVQKWCIQEHDGFGWNIVGVQDPKKLRELIFKYMCRHKKEDILPELPPKTRQRIPIDMEPAQARVYHELREHCIAEVGDTFVMAPNKMASIIKLRQLLVLPALIDPSLGVGPALKSLVAHIQENDTHAAIFTPFKIAIPHIENYLREKGFKHVVSIFGGASPEEVRDKINYVKKHRGILNSTTQFSESYSVETCSAGYVLGADWTLRFTLQSEDRLHRMTSLNPVTLYYLTYNGTVDEDIWEVLSLKNTTQKEVLDIEHVEQAALHEAIIRRLKKSQ